MAVTSTATREIPAPAPHANPPNAPASTNTRPSRSTNTGRPIPARASRTATDDEILGLDSAPKDVSVGAQHAVPGKDASPDDAHTPSVPTESGNPQQDPGAAQTAEPEALRATLDANPDLRRAWDDAQAYRESFASPDDARNATALLADLDRMDALFFSRRPEDHAELARAVASLDPAAFASLAQAMNGLATGSAAPGNFPVGARYIVPGADARRDAANPATSPGEVASSANQTQPTAAQTEFFHATNAAAVQSVIEAIESQVERLLPEGVSKSARNRVVGEIYRELDTTLQSNRQLAQQMRDAFRSGALDAAHQRAVVSLVTGRARQALPGVAKRVLNEWTSTIVAANQDRRTRQRAAEHRVDIAGSGGAASDGQRSMSPRDIDYRRMSDADILNL
jgi:hypothetical protein